MTRTGLNQRAPLALGSSRDPAQHSLRYAAARELVVSAARGGWVGDLAREVGLEQALDLIFDDPERVGTALFRAHHERHALAASPVALDLFRQLGLDIDAAVEGVRPDDLWPSWTWGAPARPASLSPVAPAKAGAGHDGGRERLLYGRYKIRSPGEDEGGLRLRFSDAGLEVDAELFGGRVRLHTLRGEAHLTTDILFPETVKAAAIGRAIEEVYDHPALRGRGYVVTSSGDVDQGGSPDDELWRVTFAVPMVPWRVPWARPALAGRGGSAAERP